MSETITYSQRQEAFLYACEVLNWLMTKGVNTASAQLYADGSGRLIIGNKHQVTDELRKEIGLKLHSNRWTQELDGRYDKLVLDSCQGWHP